MSARFSQRNWELEIDEQSKEYWRWRDIILYTEEHLLEALCFDFDVVHPYDYLLELVNRFTPGNGALGKCAWAFINDRYDSGPHLTSLTFQSSDTNTDNVPTSCGRSSSILFWKKIYTKPSPS